MHVVFAIEMQQHFWVGSRIYQRWEVADTVFVVLLATLFFVEAVVIEVLAIVANAIFPKKVGVPAYFHKT